MIKTVQQTWDTTWYSEPHKGICIIRKELGNILAKHDFTLKAARELIKAIEEAITEAENL